MLGYCSNSGMEDKIAHEDEVKTYMYEEENERVGSPLHRSTQRWSTEDKSVNIRKINQTLSECCTAYQFFSSSVNLRYAAHKHGSRCLRPF